jgi:ABC-type transport system involved in cytochrome c biogenesis permease subunit
MSRTLFELSFFTYLVAFGDYVVALFSSRKIWRILGPAALGLGLLVEAAALVTRWVDAGQIGLAAMQQALGHPLTGRAWWLTALGHPPYTNFYESLTFLSFAVLLVYFVSERWWKVSTLGTAAGCVVVGIGLVLLGRALIAPNPQIAPLEPALQSFWILIHVWNLFIAYACFLVACGFGLAFLFKVGTPSSEIGALLAALAAPVVLLAGGTSSLFGHLSFQMSPVGLNANGLLAPLQYLPAGTDKAQRVLVNVPWVGPFLLLAALLYALAALFYLTSVRRGDGEVGPRHLAYRLTLAATAALGVATAVLCWAFWIGGPVALPKLDGQVGHGVSGPYHLAFSGNPDAVGLLLLILICSLAFLGFTHFRNRLAPELPEAKQLDEITYRVIAVGFPFLALGIVTGALWAHQTWGRYWGWDPKETWALITFLVYAGYLHARLALGWTGKPAAFIAVAGFAVVVFCYLGVNLGLTGDLLHSYGAG